MLVLLLGCHAAATPADGVAPIVLISLDTLRADRLGAYGNPDGLTPSLDRFAREAVVFEHAYSQSTTTSASHASLFTSRYPSEQSTASMRPSIAPQTKTLAEVLSAYGWRCAAFVGGGQLSAEMGVGRGFAPWTAVGEFSGLWHTTPPALAWLDDEPTSPYLLFVHGYDAHMPYLKPPPYGYSRSSPGYQGAGQAALLGTTDLIRDGWLHADELAIGRVDATEPRPRSPEGREKLLRIAQAGAQPPVPFLDADAEHVRATYDAGVAYADTLFGLLMAGLAERGVLDEAIVVVISDHGEQMGEYGMYQHSPGAADAEAHVVLMVRMPGGATAARVAGQVELVDVMPTLLELSGAVAPTGIRGQSLVEALRGAPFPGRPIAWTQGGLGHRSLSARIPKGRLIYDGIALRSPIAAELIGAAALPGPSFSVVDGALSEPEQAALQKAMVGFQGGLSAASATTSNLSPELTRELREHGYWEAR